MLLLNNLKCVCMVELFENSIKLIEKNIFSFLIMLIIFVLANLILSSIALIIFSFNNTLIFSIIYGIFSAIEFLIFAIYIASLGGMSNSIIENKTVDYVSSIKKGVDIVKARSSITYIR